MMFAGHLPKLSIEHNYWLSLPVKRPDGAWWPPGNYKSVDDRGKGIVIHLACPEEDGCSHAFRPIIRVPMGRA